MGKLVVLLPAAATAAPLRILPNSPLARAAGIAVAVAPQLNRAQLVVGRTASFALKARQMRRRYPFGCT
ncbi:MAG: hypothetical protein M3Z10_03870 [Gemmatimonadota bacterium]|nr:hypothetical protein [Gemmatimonadota bacterium]